MTDTAAGTPDAGDVAAPVVARTVAGTTDTRDDDGVWRDAIDRAPGPAPSRADRRRADVRDALAAAEAGRA